MRKISPEVREIIDARPQICGRWAEGTCKGRITREHALIYAGRQIDEAWAIPLICAYHHGVDEFQDCGDLQKERNVWIALNQATDEELLKYSKVINYVRERDRLNKIYGKYNKPRQLL